MRRSYPYNAWWRHQMETFSALLDLCEGNPPVTGGFCHKGQWRFDALMFSLICARTNGWANNQNTGELRRHRTHYDVTVMAIVNTRKDVFYVETGPWPCHSRSALCNIKCHELWLILAGRLRDETTDATAGDLQLSVWTNNGGGNEFSLSRHMKWI